MKDNDGNNQVSFEISLSGIGCLLIIFIVLLVSILPVCLSVILGN